MSNNILRLPTDETMAAGFAAIAQALENGGGSGGGGGAPANHDHKLSDVYIPVATGGDWDTTIADISDELAEAINNNESAVAYMTTENKSTEYILEHSFYKHSMEPMEDSNGNQFYPLMFQCNKAVLKTKLSPNSSVYDLVYGNIATIPETFDGEDISAITLTSSENDITVTIGENTYEGALAETALELFMLLSGSMDSETAATLLDKFGGKVVATSINIVDENGDPYNESVLTFGDILDNELLANMFMIKCIVFVPVSDLQPYMETIQSEDDFNELVEIHFDAIEEASVIKKPVLGKVQEMINAGKLQLRTLASEEAYDNLDYAVKHDPNMLFLIQED